MKLSKEQCNSLKRRMRAMGVTARQLADETDIPETTVYHALNGRYTTKMEQIIRYIYEKEKEIEDLKKKI